MSGPNAHFEITRLASLIEAGVPISALETELTELQQKMRPVDALRLRAFLKVAKAKGSPIASVLRQFAEDLDFNSRFEAQLQLAMAAPLASAKLINRLPFALIGLVQFSGLANYFSLIGNPLMMVILAVGVALLLVANYLGKHLVAKAQKSDPDDSDLFTIARLELAAGTHHELARTQANSLFLEEHQRDPSLSVQQMLSQSFDVAQRWGAAIDTILGANQMAYRSARQNLLLQQAQQLSVRLLLPLGLVALPGFLIITVLPIAVAMLAK